VIPDFSFQISTLTGAQPANALKRGSPIEELADGMTNLAATTNGHHDQVPIMPNNFFRFYTYL
jgi:hypothetical protein